MGNTRTATPKVMERLLQRVDERVDDILAAYLDNLAADDPEIRMKAADRLLNRAYGTPKATSEVAVSGGMTLDALFVRDPLQPTHTPLPEDDT